MYIVMTGIDHSKAPIALREQFSFTKAGAAEAMAKIKREYALDGCILISTCNRTELWVSKDEADRDISLTEMLCGERGFSAGEYAGYFTERRGEEAVSHLLKLTCGLESRIFGEDQIISQVREALALARKHHCEDMALEKLFQTAIAAAKKVKSSVRLSAANVNPSTASYVVRLLKSQMTDLRGLPCLIIGNGQMGRLVAAALISQGADVTMTLRKRIHGKEEQSSIVPENCSMLPYEERLNNLERFKVVISATLSPHYTIHKCDLEKMKTVADILWMDLAVPRDIDPEVSLLGATVYDIDSLAEFSGAKPEYGHIKEAEAILKHYGDNLRRWFDFREQIPEIKRITRLAAEDTEKRLGEPLEKLHPQSKEEISKAVYGAAEKSVGKLLYGLKDTLPSDLWQACLEALSKSAERDTLKS